MHRGVLFALVAVAVLLASSIALAPNSNPSQSAAVASASAPQLTSGVLPANAIPPAEFAQLTTQDGVNASELAELSSEGFTSAEIEAAYGLRAASINPEADCLATLLIGCGIGLAYAALVTAWGDEVGGALNTSRYEYNALSLLVNDLGNQWNETQAFGLTMLSTLNQTQYAMDTAADSAALDQLGNSSWNPWLDTAQTPIPASLISVVNPIVYAYGGALNHTEQVLDADYGTPGQGYYGGSYFVTDSTNAIELGCEGAGAGGNCVVPASGGAALIAGAGHFYLEKGANFQLVCESSGSATSVDGDAPVITTSGTTYSSSDWQGQSDVYSLSSSDCYAGGYGILPLETGFPSTGFVSGGAATGYLVSQTCKGGACDPVLNATTDFSGEEDIISSDSLVIYSGSPDAEPVAGSPAAVMSAGQRLGNTIVNDVSSIVTASQANAQVYWAYLRSLGYDSASSVPANCLIPMPAFSLPPALSDDLQAAAGNFTTQFSFYLAWINSLATFFDTPESTSTFCTGHPIYSIGNSSWGDLDVNVTGFIYIPGKAWAAAQTLVNSDIPELSKTSTWTFNGSSPSAYNYSEKGNASHAIQFTGWPTLGSVTIPIGKVYEVPKNDPLEIIPTAFLTFLTLVGNGTDVTLNNQTANSLVPMATAPGDAIYITSCVVSGVPQASDCNLTYSTIQQYLPNITCGTGVGGACHSFSQGNGGQFSLGGLCSWIIISTICGLFGGFGSSILTALIVILVVAVAAYVVYRLLTRRSERGGSQQTVVLRPD